MARHDKQVTHTAGRPSRLRRRVEALTAATVPMVPAALHLALLDIPFAPLEPAGLRDRCAVLADRLRRAADRYPAQESR